MTSLLNISIALLAGLLMTRVFNLWNLPDVTAFLTAGLLIGPCALGRLGIPGLGFPTYDNVEALSLLSDVAMGFIAFSIGTEFRLESLQKTGKQAFVIGVFQGVTAAVLVDIAMICLHMWKPDLLSMPAAITLGAIATATAPAATLMVVRQYKAKGELTELLLPIVALDDAVGLIVFAVSFGIAKAMLLGKIDIISIAVGPLIKILASLMLGTLAGIALTRLETMFHSNTNRNSMTIAFVILTVGLSSLGFAAGPLTIGFSPLLVCMMLGTVFCNISPLAEDLMARADKWSQPLLAVFFVVSGAELELAVFQDPMLVLIGVVFILSRCLGKYSGAFVSAGAAPAGAPGRNPVPPGRRGPGHVHPGKTAGRRRLSCAEYYPLCRTYLRDGRPADDKEGPHRRGRYRRAAAGGPGAAREETGCSAAEGFPSMGAEPPKERAVTLIISKKGCRSTAFFSYASFP